MYDLVLLHPPSIYDFRTRTTMYGPISDVIPSTPVFEMYPIGFVTISGYLAKHGYQTRIINIAVKMLESRKYDVEMEIRKLNPGLAFGIDLHWLPHVEGGLEIAKIIKKYHPNTPIVFGGLSASYFHQELIGYPEVDFVIRGDSTEEPTLLLLQALRNGKGDFNGIPNLTYKGEGGNVKVNEISCVPSELDGIDYQHIIGSVIKYRDLRGYTPFQGWRGYPITMVLTCRGCSYSCKTCGGSASSYFNWCNRTKPAYRKPELVAQDLRSIGQYFKGPIFIIGDIQQPGQDYADILFSALKDVRIDNHVVFEFFDMPTHGLLEKIASAFPRFNIQISPESHDESIRRSFGRPYGNREMEETIDTALKLGCQKLDLFFMIGLSGQTSGSVLETVGYCDYLLEKFGSGRRLFPFIAPLAPFLDPGSEAFENPQKFGYRLFYRTLEEHRLAMLAPSWKYMLSYETEWMTRDEIVNSSYHAASEMNKIKRKYGLIDNGRFAEIDSRIKQAVALMQRLDEIVQAGQPELVQKRLKDLKEETDRLRTSTICNKNEIEWPVRLFGADVPAWIPKVPLLNLLTAKFMKYFLGRPRKAL